MAANALHEIKAQSQQPGVVQLHWLDNFARTFARQGLYFNRNQFVNLCFGLPTGQSDGLVKPR